MALASVAAEAKLAGIPKAFRNQQPTVTKKSAKPFNYAKAAKQFGLLLSVAVSFAFLSVMHSYHEALRKQEQLTKLFNNPNARVAAGAKGKNVLKELQTSKKQAAKKVKAVKQAPKKVTKVDKTQETLSQILKLLEEQNKAKVAQQAQQVVEPPTYQPPVLTTAPAATNNQTFSYQLYDQANVYPTMPRPEIYTAPQPQPLLIPQQPAPAVQVKKETKSSPTLEEIIGLLKKTQAAQIDLES